MTLKLAPLPPELDALSKPLRTQAFTHRSLRARQLKKEDTNERLEFLGDAVLELVISEYLYSAFPKADEGILTRYRAALVRTESLALVAQELHLGEHLQANLGEGEEIQGEMQFPSILADTYEAVLGALYLSTDYQTCSKYVHKYLLPHRPDFITALDAKDPKSLLQEKLQAQGKPAPEYEIVREEGPDHAKTFIVSVQLPGVEKTLGEGASKQKAEQAAAEAALVRYFPD